MNLALGHTVNYVWEFYSKLPRPVLVGIEATGSMPQQGPQFVVPSMAARSPESDLQPLLEGLCRPRWR